ncbi:uncharacterized protein LOC109710402 [Ananas comosus]|uniref:Uncharacterized protein LOC109710402 n=1 Tax=Ananas comosus TaxID=4615 RepID=A0A6P5EY90_ANACO|nr:uncharacterized protein LOC109710402 [Ananas comosus]
MYVRSMHCCLLFAAKLCFFGCIAMATDMRIALPPPPSPMSFTSALSFYHLRACRFHACHTSLYTHCSVLDLNLTTFPLVCATLDSIACTATTGKDSLAYCYMCMQHYHCLVLRQILDPNCFAVEHPQLKLQPRSCSLALRSTSSEEEDRQALGPPFFRPNLFIHGSQLSQLLILAD